jgi:SAM-dependent methyltransferase
MRHEKSPLRRYGITGNPDYGSKPFTDIQSVTPETPLERLNLNWRECDLPERERTKHVHRLHPYLGKFVPQLVEIFLRKYQPRTVCDPFCGSGTTLVEANCLGIQSVGCDVCEFNCLLTRAKLEHYDLLLLQREVQDILERLRLGLESPLFRQETTHSLEQASPYLRTWYAPRALRQLLYFKSLIPNYRYQLLFQVILSRAARSARLTTHYELDFPKKPQTQPYYCHKHKRVCKPTQDALQFLVRYCADALRRIEEFQKLRTSAPFQILCGDARNVKFPPTDLVVTSPPYVGLIDYHEQHRYAYELLDLPMQVESEIGRASLGQSQAAIQRYLDDMSRAFANVLESLRPGGRVVIVVYDRFQLYDHIASRLGCRVEHRFQRHVNRRTGRRATDFFEDVIIWRV